MRFLIYTILTLSSLTACNPGISGGTRHSVAGTEYPGLWLEKKDADELRGTGKMDSYCPELKKYPNSKIINVRLIEPSGDVYAYDPSVAKGQSWKIGVLQPNGKLETSPLMKTATGDRDMKASVKNGILKIAIDTEGAGPIEYVRSDVKEVKKYVAALDNCNN